MTIMAIYMCSVKVIKRSEGKSIVAASAYRSGSQIENKWDGVNHNYTNKKWISHTEILLPPNAPSEYLDRGKLWNAVELSEKSSDARLGKEVLIALPREMSIDEQILLTREYVKQTFVDSGMCADIAIHNPPLKNDLGQPIDYKGNILENPDDYIFPNPHAHILLTMRPIDQNGKWEGKSCIEYICKKDGAEKAFTADEYKSAKEKGWMKQYKYIDGNKKIWLTEKEATERHLVRSGKNPKTSKQGRPNPTVARWESKDTLFNWRKNWEEIANRHLRQNGYSSRIDSRSYINQGKKDMIPTVHMGVSATNMMRRYMRESKSGRTNSIIPELAKLNIEIKKYNNLVIQLTGEIDKISKRINELEKDASDNIDAIKKELDKYISERDKNTKLLREKQYELDRLKDKISLITNTVNKVTEANRKSYAKIDSCNEKLSSLGRFNFAERKKLTEIISQENTAIKNRETYMSNIFNKHNIVSISEINQLINI